MAGPQDLPSDVRDATDRHLAVLDAVAPGLVGGLYLTGSVTLGDYQPGRSDIDFMAFTTRPADDPDMVALLARVHESLGLSIVYDGNYVTMAGLPDVPDDERPAPHVVNGTFHADDPNHQLTPPTWAEFARYAITVRGPQARELGVCVPRDRLSGWTLGNLNGYWKRTAEDAIVTLRPHDSGEVIAAGVGPWITLGPARLHYTLATGDIASKSAAGRYAIDTFPAYRDVVSAALDWRSSGDGKFTYADCITGAELAIEVVADANRRWG